MFINNKIQVKYSQTGLAALKTILNVVVESAGIKGQCSF